MGGQAKSRPEKGVRREGEGEGGRGRGVGERGGARPREFKRVSKRAKRGDGAREEMRGEVWECKADLWTKTYLRGWSSKKCNVSFTSPLRHTFVPSQMINRNIIGKA